MPPPTLVVIGSASHSWAETALLVNLAEVVGCSRQNLRKYAAGEIKTVAVPFPEPVCTGHPSLWRLTEVAAWLDRHTDLHPPRSVSEIARVTAKLNLDLQRARLRDLAAE